MKKTLTLLFITLIFFGCKKDNKEYIANQKSEIITTSEAKAFLGSLSHRKTESTNDSNFNPASLLEKIDWENASPIDSGKALIGATSGQPIVNGTKIGFRKSVFFKDSLGNVDMIIYEFVPDIYHLWKYKGIKKDSFDGKVFVYDKNYHLTKGYLYKSGIAIGEIVPTFISTTQQTAIRKTEALVYSCSSNVEVYLNGGGYYEAYFILTCNSYYVPSSYIGNTSKFEEVLDGGGGGGGSSGVMPVPVPISDDDIANAIPVDDGKQPIDPEKFKKCFDDGKQASSYKLTLYIDQPIYGSNDQWTTHLGTGNYYSTLQGISFDVGHAFVGFEKINTDGTSVSQYMGFYPGNIALNAQGVIKDDSGHSFDVSYSSNVNSTQFQFALNNVIADSQTKSYILSNNIGGAEYNCTDAAIHWMVNAGVNLPNSSSRGIFNNTPGDFGQSLRQLNNANKSAGFAPNGHGACN